MLFCKHLKMPGVDTAALRDKVSHSHRPFVIYQRIWHVDHAQSLPGYTGLNGDLIDGGIGGNSFNDITKGDHFTELGGAACHAVMQSPEQVYRVPRKGVLIVDRYRARANHADARIGKMRAQPFQSVLLWNGIRSHQDEYRARGLLQKEIDSGGLSLAAFLHNQPYARFILHEFLHDRNRAVGAAAGYHGDIRHAGFPALLLDDGSQCAQDIGLFVVGHHSNTVKKLLRLRLYIRGKFSFRAGQGPSEDLVCHNIAPLLSIISTAVFIGSISKS